MTELTEPQIEAERAACVMIKRLSNNSDREFTIAQFCLKIWDSIKILPTDNPVRRAAPHAAFLAILLRELEPDQE